MKILVGSKRITKKLKKSSYVKNIAKISSGTLIGQCVSLITVPIFSRLYGPTTIGSWQFMYSIITIINACADLGMSKSIMTCDEYIRKHLYCVITTLSSIFSLISGICFFGYYILKGETIETASFMGIMMILGTITTKQIDTCYIWLNREGRYHVLMKNPAINTGVFGVVGILLAYLGMNKYGYFIGWISGQIFTLIHMRRFIPNKFFTFKISEYKEVIRYNNRFIKYQLPTNFIGNIKNQLPSLLIRTFFGERVLGYYSISVRILQMPCTLLANAIGKVFFKESVDRMKNASNVSGFLRNNLSITMKIGIIPMIFCMSFGDVIAVFFLGSNWLTAGTIVRVLTVQYFFMFLSLAIEGIVIVLQKQELALYSILAQIIGIVCSFLVGKFVFDNVIIGILLLCLSYSAINLIYFSFLLNSAGASGKSYIKGSLVSISIIVGVTAIIRILLMLAGVVNGF